MLKHLKLVAFFTLVLGVVAMAFPMPDDPYHKPTYHAAPVHKPAPSYHAAPVHKPAPVYHG